MSRSATAIISEIRNGELVAELSDELAKALQSVQDFGKEASVTLKISIRPLTKMTLSEPALGYAGKVSAKLAEPVQEETIFFMDKSGDPSRSPNKTQAALDLSIAKIEGAK